MNNKTFEITAAGRRLINKKFRIPKGWHVAQGKELQRLERKMIREGLMHKRKAPVGTVPDPELWMDIIVKHP